MVVNRGVATRPQAHLLVIGRQLVDMAGKGGHPLPEQTRGTLDKRHDSRQVGGKPGRVEAGRTARIQALYAQLGTLLGRAPAKGLAHQDIVGVRRHRQPVAGMLPGADDQFEIAILRYVQLVHIHMTRGRHVAAPRKRTGLGLDAQVGHRTPVTGDPVVAPAVHGAVEVKVVGVVVADLGSLMGQGIKLGEVGITKFDVLFQAQAQQPGQVAVTLDPGEFVSRRVGGQHLLTGAFEVVTESAPERAIGQRSRHLSPGHNN